MRLPLLCLMALTLCVACGSEAEEQPAEFAPDTEALAVDTIVEQPVEPTPPPTTELAFEDEPSQPPRDAPAVREIVAFQEIDSGIEFYDDAVWIEDARRRLSVVRITAPYSTVYLSYERAALLTYLKLEGVRIALSGGFATSFYPPVPAGYVEIGGDVMSRATDDVVLNGLLVVRRGGVDIQAVGDVELPTGGDVLQSGPLLVVGGASAISDSIVDSTLRKHVAGQYVRAFIGTDEDGRVLMGLVDGISLTSLAEYLRAPIVEGGLGCTHALNLSGDVNAGMIVKIGDVDLERGDMATPLPTAILVR